MAAVSYGIADAFALLVERESLVEVRALFSTQVAGLERVCRNQFYLGSQADDLARDVAPIDHNPECIGVYLVSNPIDPKLSDRNCSKWRKPFITKVSSSNSSHMLSRRWILVDCDSVRPPDTCATESERSAAFDLSRHVMTTLGVFGFGSPVIADSGNGCHLLYPVSMGADKASTQLVKEFLAELTTRCYSSGAIVDPVTFDSTRMIRLYGTRSRKGPSTAERPWRTTGIISPGECTEAVRQSNVVALKRSLEIWADQKSLLNRSGKSDPIQAARTYIQKIPPAVAGSGGHGSTYRVASLLVESFALSDADSLGLLQEWNAGCVPPWSDYDLSHKISDARKKIDNSRLGCLLSVRVPDKISVSPTIDPSVRTVATVADLIRMGKSLQWIWEGWIQRGALVCVAAEPGAGKTRFCADLTRRINSGECWPDGAASTLDKGSTVMWLACDGQWGEITQFPEQFGFPPEAIFLNAWNSDPTEGTILDKEKDFKLLEEKILLTGVSLVFVDTVMNSTSHNTMRPEDGIKFFKPLAEVAHRTNTSIILVTHLSAGGEALGRRITGQCRQVIEIRKIEGEDVSSKNRRVFVSKSNSIFPPELQAAMETGENTYALTALAGGGDKLADWIEDYLEFGGKAEIQLLIDSSKVGFSRDRVLAKLKLCAENYLVNGHNWFRNRSAKGGK